MPIRDDDFGRNPGSIIGADLRGAVAGPLWHPGPGTPIVVLSAERFPVSSPKYAAATALAEAAAAAGAVGGEVVIDRDVATLGNIDITNLHNLSFVGAGNPSVDIVHADSWLFKYGSNVFSETFGIRMIGFTVTSSVVRTGGGVLTGVVPYNVAGNLQDCLIRGLTVKKQVNGFKITQYDYLGIESCLLYDFVGTGGRAIQFGQTTATLRTQGADAWVSNTNIVGHAFLTNGAAAAVLDYGIWVEDCDAIRLTDVSVLACKQNGMRIVANSPTGTHNHFINKLVMDQMGSHAAMITGGGDAGVILFDSLCGLGGGGAQGVAAGHGLHCDVANMYDLILDGCVVSVNTGSGVYLRNNCSAILNNMKLITNGSLATAGDNDGINIAMSANVGEVIVRNCHERGSNGVGIRTSATTNRVFIDDSNVFKRGRSLGVTPLAVGRNITMLTPGALDGRVHQTHTQVGTDADTAEKTLNLFTLKGNTLSVDGQQLVIRVRVSHAANGNTKSDRLYVCGANILMNNVTTAPNGGQLVHETVITRLSANTQMRESRGVWSDGATTTTQQLITTSRALAQDLTADSEIKVTGTNGTASANDIVLESFTVDLITNAAVT